MPPTSATPPEQTPHHVPGGARRSGDPSAGAARRGFLVIVAVLALAGVVTGLLWAALRPDVQVVMTQVGPMPVDEVQAGGLASMDSWYAVLGGGAGILLGATLATVFLRHGVITVVALATGGCVAAVLSFVAGSLVANQAVVLSWKPGAALGASLSAPLTLHAHGFFLVWPIAVLAPVLPLAWLGWSGEELDEEADPIDIHRPGAPA